METAMPNLTDKEIIALFKKEHPQDVEHLRMLGVEATVIKQGTARTAYRIGEGLCVKFEFNPEGQSKHEIICIRLVNRKPEFKDLRKHVPTLYYGNKKTGTLLMKYYPNELPYSPLARAQRDKLSENFRTRLNIIDLHDVNFRMDENGNLVVIDLGWKGYTNV